MQGITKGWPFLHQSWRIQSVWYSIVQQMWRSSIAIMRQLKAGPSSHLGIGNPALATRHWQPTEPASEGGDGEGYRWIMTDNCFVWIIWSMECNYKKKHNARHMVPKSYYSIHLKYKNSSLAPTIVLRLCRYRVLLLKTSIFVTLLAAAVGW